MTGQPDDILHGELLDEALALTLAELSRRCRVAERDIIALVEEGILEPRGAVPGEWRFAAPCVRRVQVAIRLERDLGINRAGVALALDLLDELAWLRQRLARHGR